MIKGIDVSHNNEKVDWKSVKRAGFTFAMIRVGYGKGNIDREFYNNVNGALSHGLKIGIYHYSYALSTADAKKEASFIVSTLKQCGLTPKKLIGVYYDMEDADGYKSKHGMPSKQVITNICSVVINALWKAGYTAGIYANNDWLDNHIDMSQLGGCALWLAQPGATKPRRKCNIWQYTFTEKIDGKIFDADLMM
ncbi:GH25 family lysozyme [Allisonella histaminiformans]|uniref:GH25 family lysozyme n=1 Tax=Allisonella histaminiformans TaxID=209880 RepID=UPI002E778EB9|nr:GH25 family lysozyme [Allisonella histaminiformans]